jgi:hypothetical protein
VRRVLPIVVVLAAILAGCGEDAGGVFATPVPTPSPPQQAVIIYVLIPSQVPGFKRTSEFTVNAKTLADQKGDQGLTYRLGTYGFVHGARANYAPPPATNALAFSAISSEALMFNDAAGATKYFAEEAKRVNQPPPGGTVDPLAGLPRQHIDDMVAYSATQPPQGGDAIDRAFIVLIRTGRVVAEIFARGASPTATTVDAFTPLVSAEQTLLARPPDG